MADKNYDKPLTKILVGANKDGWHDFNAELPAFSDVYERTENSPCGNDPMVMFFTSGTTGYPKIASHSYKYALGHFVTAKYWHSVTPEDLHLTISDTGWGKAMWGKFYGQWMSEGAVFTYDFDRFGFPQQMLILPRDLPPNSVFGEIITENNTIVKILF